MLFSSVSMLLRACCQAGFDLGDLRLFLGLVLFSRGAFDVEQLLRSDVGLF